MSTSAPSTAGQHPAGRPSAYAQETGTTRTLQKAEDARGQVVSRVRRTVLPGGLRVVSEEMTGTRSVTLGVWVMTGSRHESRARHGCSHFLEHLLFKGTADRSALQISQLMDEAGGDFNAFTTKEYTCFHARVLDEDLPTVVDVLGDMITNSVLTDDDVEAEREIILDEIAMHDDDPEDLVHTLLALQAYGDTPLGRPIAGTAESITGLTRSRIERFYRTRYRPEQIVVTAAGNIAHHTFARAVGRAFGRADFLAGEAAPVPAAVTDRSRAVRSGELRTQRPTEQLHLALGFGALNRTDPRRYALGVLNAALGGGTSSRLFQEVRERRGLAYSVYSYASAHADSGMLGIAAGCLPGRYDDLRATVEDELARVARDGITAEELSRGQGQLRRNLIMGLEDSASRMTRLGKAELFHGELPTLDDLLQRIDTVTLDDVGELAATVLTRRPAVAVVGPE